MLDMSIFYRVFEEYLFQGARVLDWGVGVEETVAISVTVDMKLLL